MLGSFAVCALLSCAVCLLYLENLDALRYGALLCGACGALCLAYGFWRFCRRHRVLETLCGNVLVELGELPDADDLIEDDYRALIWALHTALARERAEARRTRAELADYFTLWTHQIKTPIAAMGLLLQAGESDPAALSAELFRIERYAEMALSYARLEEGPRDLCFNPVRLDEVVRRAAREYARLFILRHVRIEIGECARTVLSDEKWLGFVLGQLLSNAVKYTPAGGTVTVTVEEPCTLAMRDTGIGIAASDLPRIFERGYTGYNGRTYERATGLGLYLVRRVCDMLGHKVAIESGPDGTTARLYLAREERTIE